MHEAASNTHNRESIRGDRIPSRPSESRSRPFFSDPWCVFSTMAALSSLAGILTLAAFTIDHRYRDSWAYHQSTLDYCSSFVISCLLGSILCGILSLLVGIRCLHLSDEQWTATETAGRSAIACLIVVNGLCTLLCFYVANSAISEGVFDPGIQQPDL